MPNHQDAKLKIAMCLLLGAWLMSTPRCSSGCRTLAEHLISHGLDELLAGLF